MLDDQRTLVALLAQARTSESEGDFSEAAECYRQAAEIQERMLQAKSNVISISLWCAEQAERKH